MNFSQSWMSFRRSATISGPNSRLFSVSIAVNLDSTNNIASRMLEVVGNPNVIKAQPWKDAAYCATIGSIISLFLVLASLYVLPVQLHPTDEQKSVKRTEENSELNQAPFRRKDHLRPLPRAPLFIYQLQLNITSAFQLFTCVSCRGGSRPCPQCLPFLKPPSRHDHCRRSPISHQIPPPTREILPMRSTNHSLSTLCAYQEAKV